MRVDRYNKTFLFRRFGKINSYDLLCVLRWTLSWSLWHGVCIHWLVKTIFYSDNLHACKYIQCRYIKDLIVSFNLLCKPFPDNSL